MYVCECVNCVWLAFDSAVVVSCKNSNVYFGPIGDKRVSRPLLSANCNDYIVL
jgi:hypothetical protein